MGKVKEIITKDESSYHKGDTLDQTDDVNLTKDTERRARPSVVLGARAYGLEAASSDAVSSPETALDFIRLMTEPFPFPWEVRRLVYELYDSIMPEINIMIMRKGLDRSEIDKVAAIADLTKKEIARLLGKSERNIYYGTAKPLSLLQSEHLINLKVLFSCGLSIFDGNKNAFSDWLRSPKQALAVPETGFPTILPEDYKKPSIGELFAPHTQEENRLAIEKNMAYNKQRALEQTKPFPTPLSILDSPTGLRLVSDILGRIDAGVYS